MFGFNIDHDSSPRFMPFPIRKASKDGHRNNNISSNNDDCGKYATVVIVMKQMKKPHAHCTYVVDSAE